MTHNEDKSYERESETSDDVSSESRHRPRKPARHKIMDLLARRDHSELELKQKLSVSYERDEVEDALRYARENNWLKEPSELAVSVAEQLGRRGKGVRYIKRYLASKGLPGVEKNSDEEKAKALALVQMKLQLEPPFEYEQQKKIARILTNRGFDDETIRKVLHEKP